jgi:hypothetical protein
MPAEFSEMEQSIIKNMMLRKSYKEIARMLDCDIEQLAFYIIEEVEGMDVITWQMKLDEKKAKAPKKPTLLRPVKVVKQKELSDTQKLKIEQRKEEDLKKQIKLAAYKNRMSNENESKYRRRPPNYKTIPVDYTKLVTIRIDKSTTIYSIPGEEEKTKTRFLKHYSKPIDRFKL